MSRQSTRPSSPTSASLSGLSTYLTDSDRSAHVSTPASSAPVFIDYCELSRIPYAELGRFLGNYLATSSSLPSLISSNFWLLFKDPSKSSKLKLTILSNDRFYELSTDIYDEINHRSTRDEGLPNCSVLWTTFSALFCSPFHPGANEIRWETQ